MIGESGIREESKVLPDAIRVLDGTKERNKERRNTFDRPFHIFHPPSIVIYRYYRLSQSRHPLPAPLSRLMLPFRCRCRPLSNTCDPHHLEDGQSKKQGTRCSVAVPQPFKYTNCASRSSTLDTNAGEAGRNETKRNEMNPRANVNYLFSIRCNAGRGRLCRQVEVRWKDVDER